MCSNALDSRGKPAVSPMSGSLTFDIDKKNRNSANLKLRNALRAGGVIILLPFPACWDLLTAYEN